MASRTADSSIFLFRRSPFWHSVFVVIWTIWAVLTVHEYVDESFGLPAFLFALVGGVLIGAGFFALMTRTHRGRKAKRLYDDAPLGQQFAIGVVLLVPLAVLMYGSAAFDVSLVLLQVVLLSTIFGYYRSAFVSSDPAVE